MNSINKPGGARLTVRVYVADDGTTPFRDWLATLEMPTRARIQARVLRFELGNRGDHKSVGAGVWEARFFFGPGYRPYFGSYCCSADRSIDNAPMCVELTDSGATTWS